MKISINSKELQNQHDKHEHIHHGNAEHKADHQHSNCDHDHHGHNHDHGLFHHHGSSDNKQGLIIALIITFSIMILEFIGGLITNSLALLSDSGHMLSDSSSLLLSLIAFGLAAKAATSKRSFGNHRFEIIAAFVNAITLFVVAGFIVYEAIERLFAPPTVSSGTMILIASIGLLANLLSAFFLMRKGDVQHNLNMRSAYLHVIGDALGSVGAIIAGLIMLAFNWYWADPLISIFVAILILRSAWSVLAQSLHILMEGTPRSIDHNEVLAVLTELPHVVEVHDLHIWTITSNKHSLSCHLVVDDSANGQKVLQSAIDVIKQKYKLNHITIQVETSHIHHDACEL